MSKASYEIVVIEKGRELEYRQYWEEGVLQNGVDPSELSFTITVEAFSKREAMEIARLRYPRHTIPATYARRL